MLICKNDFGTIALNESDFTRAQEELLKPQSSYLNLRVYINSRMKCPFKIDELSFDIDSLPEEGEFIVKTKAYQPYRLARVKDHKILTSEAFSYGDLDLLYSYFSRQVADGFGSLEMGICRFYFEQFDNSVLIDDDLIASSFKSYLEPGAKPLISPAIELPPDEVIARSWCLNSEDEITFDRWGSLIKIEKIEAKYRVVEIGERGGIESDNEFSGLDQARVHFFKTIFYLDGSLNRDISLTYYKIN